MATGAQTWSDPQLVKERQKRRWYWIIAGAIFVMLVFWGYFWTSTSPRHFTDFNIGQERTLVDRTPQVGTIFYRSVGPSGDVDAMNDSPELIGARVLVEQGTWHHFGGPRNNCCDQWYLVRVETGAMTGMRLYVLPEVLQQ